MSGYELASIIGAAAWLYPLGVLAHKLITKPKVSVLTDEYAELGYSTYGPIVNIRLAFTSERKDAVIEKVELIVKHKEGDTHTLTWKSLEETEMELRPISGIGGGTLSKSDAAIALRVSTSLVSQKKVGFHDNGFTSEMREVDQKLKKQIAHLTLTNKEKLLENLVASSEYRDYMAFLKHKMYWRVGQYTIILKAFIYSVKNPFETIFSVDLDEIDVDSLSKNCEIVEDTIGFLMKKKADKDDPVEPPQFFWAYPRIGKSNQQL